MNRVLKLHKKLSKYPFGNVFFSRAVARMAPYFTTIKPNILEIRHNYILVSMKNRRSVQNHLKTVHAIAMCNLCEFAGGICMEASIPKHRRWIPAGMEVQYLKKAKTDLTASCDLSKIDWDNCSEVFCMIDVKDRDEQVVMTAKIRMDVRDRK